MPVVRLRFRVIRRVCQLRIALGEDQVGAGMIKVSQKITFRLGDENILFDLSRLFHTTDRKKEMNNVTEVMSVRDVRNKEKVTEDE